MSGFGQRDHFAINIKIQLVVLEHAELLSSLSHFICCTSIAAPVPKIHSLKSQIWSLLIVRKMEIEDSLLLHYAVPNPTLQR